MTAAPAQPAPAAFELPTPTGRFAVGTASWRLTDRSRPETFAPGEFRQVEVIAWYPATPGGGATAPYLREGLGEVRPFAKLFGAETAFDKVESVRTHAELDAAPAAAPRRFPVLVFSHGYTGMASSYTALHGRPGEPRLRRAQRRPSIRGWCRDARGRPDRVDERPGRDVPSWHSGCPRRVGRRRRDDGLGDARHGRRRSRCVCCAVTWARCITPASCCAGGSTIPGWCSTTCRISRPPAPQVGWPAARPAPDRRVRPLDGRRDVGAVLRRRPALPRRAEPGRHPAIRADDRHADGAAVPDGVFGAAGPRRRERSDLPSLGAPVLSRRHEGDAAPGVQRHGVLGRAAARTIGAWHAAPRRAPPS